MAKIWKILTVLQCVLYLMTWVQCDENSLIFVQDENDMQTNDNDDDDDSSTISAGIFQATNDWQDVGDQILPKGLHVRINLETGKKEAKLLENEDEVDVNSKITSNYQVVEQNPTKDSNHNLKDLNDFKVISKSNSKKFKTIEEIKQANLKITSESELMKKVIENYSREKDPIKRAALASDLEYFVHSIDLSNDLFQLKGFDILLKDLNETSAELRFSILNVFGSAVQGNIRLKNELYKSDFLRQIVVLLHDTKDPSLLKKCLFVLSAFLRNYPQAQKVFFQSYNGVEIFESLLAKDFILSTRASTLLSDICLERSNAANSSNQLEVEAYKDFQFESIIQRSHICSKLIELLGHEMEKSYLSTLVESMSNLADVCRNEFLTNMTVFRELQNRLQVENDEFTLEYLENLLSYLPAKDEL